MTLGESVNDGVNGICTDGHWLYSPCTVVRQVAHPRVGWNMISLRRTVRFARSRPSTALWPYERSVTQELSPETVTVVSEARCVDCCVARADGAETQTRLLSTPLVKRCHGDCHRRQLYLLQRGYGRRDEDSDTGCCLRWQYTVTATIPAIVTVGGRGLSLLSSLVVRCHSCYPRYTL